MDETKKADIRTYMAQQHRKRYALDRNVLGPCTPGRVHAPQRIRSAHGRGSERETRTRISSTLEQLRPKTAHGTSRQKEKEKTVHSQREMERETLAKLREYEEDDIHWDSSEHKRPNTALEQHRPTRKEESHRLHQRIKELERHLTDTQMNLREVEEERDHWENRVRKITSATFSRDTTDIAELHDPNRPQKLAKQYDQLYDNERARAMEILTETKNDKQGKRRGINILLSIIKRSYEQCVQLADNQIKELQSEVLLDENIEKSNEIQRCLQDAQKYACIVSLSTVQMKMRLCLKALEEIFGEFPLEDLVFFVDKITEMCWFMVMQNPRMEFLIPDRGDKFNKDYFKEYEKAGDTINYVVWPAMVTHKQGSLLANGVIQPLEKVP